MIPVRSWPGKIMVADLHRHRRSQPSVLIADDDESIRRVVAALLVRRGLAVDLAEDGLVAWNKLQAQRFDLLITDNAMPGYRGIDLIRTLRQTGNPVAIIVISGDDPDLFMGKNDIDIQGFLPKPFSLKELACMVERVLSENSHGTGSSLSETSTAA